MNLNKILSTLNDAEKLKLQLSLEQTLEVLEAFKKISSKKALLDQAIFLLCVVEKKINGKQRLTPRETQILHLIGLGLSTKAIAKTLSISEETVSTHRKNIIKKLNLTGTRNLNRFAFRFTNDKQNR